MVRKTLGLDRILDSIVERLGNVEAAYLTGDYARGSDTGIVDLVLVGNINHRNLDDLVTKTEKHIGRRIRTLLLNHAEFAGLTDNEVLTPRLELWSADAH